MNPSSIKPLRLSKEALITRVAMAAGIAGAAVASLVIGTPAVIFAAGVIAAIATVIVLK